MNFLNAFKNMKGAGWSDSDIVRLLSCCQEPELALDFAQYCISMRQAWSMLQALDDRSVVTFKDGAWGFENKPMDVIELGAWHD